jgi:hypothetical protein
MNGCQDSLWENAIFLRDLFFRLCSFFFFFIFLFEIVSDHRFAPATSSAVPGSILTSTSSCGRDGAAAELDEPDDDFGEELDDDELEELDDEELLATIPGSTLTSVFTLFFGLSHHNWSRRVSSDQRILCFFLPFLGLRVTSMFHSQSESRWSWPRVRQAEQVVGFLRGVGPYSGRFLKHVRQRDFSLLTSPGSLHPKHRRGPSDVEP